MRDTSQDVVVAGSLVSAPAWVPSLAQFNGWLTTFSLLVGICLGLLRLYAVLMARPRPPDDDKRNP